MKNFNITLEEGVDFSLGLKLYDTGEEGKIPLNLSSVSFRCQVRKDFKKGSPLLVEIPVSKTNASQGEVALGVGWAELQNLTTNAPANLRDSRLGFYDLIMLGPAGARKLIMKGEVTLSKTATEV